MRSLRSELLLGVSLTALAACASKVPPPAITYDSADFKPASAEAALAKPVQIVTVPQPVALPDQLQPEPSTKPKPESPVPTQRVEAANKAAIQEPTSHGYINAMQIYPFMEGALYRLYGAPEHVTDIELQAGETLTSVSAGDTVRWAVGDATSGSGPTKKVHVLVKPFQPGLNTDLVVLTDRRAYHLKLGSTDKTSMAEISWTYPEDQLFSLRQQNAKAEAAEPIASGLALEDLRFRYAITGDTPPWRPVRVFDDAKKVYIQFPDRIDQGEAPPLFVVGADGGSELVNYRVRRNYYIVDRLFAAAELRMGKDPQQVVRISRTDSGATAPTK